MPSPLTYGVSPIATTATRRSAPSNVGVRRRGAAYAHTTNTVHRARKAITPAPTRGWS